MYPEKTKRSLRRFYRRIASRRRGMLRHIHETPHTTDIVNERESTRIPTRQELRVEEAFQQDLTEAEAA